MMQASFKQASPLKQKLLHSNVIFRGNAEASPEKVTMAAGKASAESCQTTVSHMTSVAQEALPADTA